MGLLFSGWRWCIILVLTLVWLSVVSAEPSAKVKPSAQYISPRLQLGIHTQASMDSPIAALISSGTAVSVLQKKDEFTQIKTSDGNQGWIKSKFLTEDKPAALQVKELEQALKQSQEKLADLQAEKQQQEDSQPDDEQSDAGLSETEVANYEQQIRELQAEIRAWEQMENEDKQERKEQIQQINQQLQDRLSRIAVLSTGQESSADLLRTQLLEGLHQTSVAEQGFIALIKKDYLVHLVIGGICFFLGIFIMDLINRRRHGGYRI